MDYSNEDIELAKSMENDMVDYVQRNGHPEIEKVGPVMRFVFMKAAMLENRIKKLEEKE